MFFDKGTVERIDTLHGRQLLEEMSHEMTITMTGDSLTNAVGNLFQVMRKQVFEDIKYPIIQMESSEVYFEDIQLTHKTERFLFLFWPRKKTYFTITARIIVKIKYLNITKEDF